MRSPEPKEPGTASKSPAPALAPGNTAGRLLQGNVSMTQLFNETCAKCHGQGGEGGGAGTKTLNTRELFDQKHDRRFFDAIKNGVPDMGMDGYGQTMSDATVWGLVVHIRELQARALRAEFGGPKPVNGIYQSRHHRYRVTTVADQGLKTPWSIDWLPDGRALVTNRSGTLSVLDQGRIVSEVQGLPASREIGQGGLMEVAVHPNAGKNGWVYLSLTDPSKTDPRAGMTKIVRGKLRFSGDQATWTDEQTIFQVDPRFYNGSGVHFGGKIAFDGKGFLFFSIGERGSGELAQDLSRPNGKIYRIRDDGSIPADNPFASDKGNLAAIWSFGHRNPQGLSFDLDGNLWDTEHGPRGGDELNRIQRGANYGWPLVAFSINYNDAPMSTPWPKPEQKITLPALRWLPSIAASGLDVARGAAFPKWKGDLLAGGLAGSVVQRLRMKGDQVLEQEELIHGMGRVRDVATAPDGSVYVLLNGPDKIVRISPAD